MVLVIRNWIRNLALIHNGRMFWVGSCDDATSTDSSASSTATGKYNCNFGTGGLGTAPLIRYKPTNRLLKHTIDAESDDTPTALNDSTPHSRS